MINQDQKYFPLWEPPIALPAYTIPQWVIDMLEEAGEQVHEILKEQMRINPDAIEALYG